MTDVFLKSHSRRTHRTYLAEMPVGWCLLLPEECEEREISREEFEATPKTEFCRILIEGKRRTLFEAVS